MSRDHALKAWFSAHLRTFRPSQARLEAAARSPSSTSASSLYESCAECPPLRADLAARSADVEAAKEEVREWSNFLPYSGHASTRMGSQAGGLFGEVGGKF